MGVTLPSNWNPNHQVNAAEAGQLLTAIQTLDINVMDSCEVSAAGSMVSGISTVETDIPKLVLGNVAVVNGTLYRFDIRLIIQFSVTTDEFILRIRKGTAVSGTLVAEFPLYRANQTNGFFWVGWTLWPCTLSESTKFFFSAIRGSGTGTLNVYGQQNTQSRSGTSIIRAGYSVNNRVVP